MGRPERLFASPSAIESKKPPAAKGSRRLMLMLEYEYTN
jgi:hypothetical protein